jgi:O-antigen ligase
MIAINKIKIFINSTEFLAYLIALIVSTLFLGYAPSSIALGLFILFSVRYKIINRCYAKVNIAFLLPMLLYILFALTWFWTVDKSLTKTGLERTISLILIPLAFSFIPKFSLKNYKLIINIFTVSNALLGLLFLISSLFNFIKTKSISVFTYHNLVSVLDLHAIYVSLSFSISLFFLISKNKKTLYDKVGILFFLALLLLLSSKTMLVVLLISILVYISGNKIIKLSKKKVFYISIIVVLTIGLSSITLTERLLFEKDTKLNEILSKKEFGNIYPWTGSSIRLLQLRILKEQIEEESIFWKGFGLFASRDNVKKRHQEFGTYQSFHIYNYHNQYGQILAETGIIGLGLLLTMLVLMFITALRINNFLFIMFSITVMMLFFTESLLWRQHGLFLFITCYCLLNSVSLIEEYK